MSPILAVATFTYEQDEDGTEVPVCLTQADTFWSALFFILTIAIFFIVPLGVLLVLYSVIAKNLMENPVIIAQSSKNTSGTGNVIRYRKQVILMLAINPILYNLMSSKFRDGFVKLLKINKLMRCSRNLRETMQRRDTFNTTTSTGFSSSQNTSDSFWRRYSNRVSSQKNILNNSKKIKEEKVNPIKIGEIINVENTRRNSMKFIAALNEDAQIDNEVEIADNENNKQIQILNLDVKTNSVYSITLDVSKEELVQRYNKNLNLKFRVILPYLILATVQLVLLFDINNILDLYDFNRETLKPCSH
ncbi:uncharacterized protein LOC114253102 [Bombyx mandarina]|uniref:Uncharacterized protein LOC114253102 n=1 Tax=Bombyx mandarina TaxID=7092 RepID=A0A6J2KMY2_BOMMA|nr:uncharacterized protein LOC114253102 [Bombyx mandarina]